MIIDYSGSFVSILVLLLAALVTRNDIMTVITSTCALGRGKAESFPDSATLGSLWSAHLGRSLTIAYIHALAKFPGVLSHIKSEGVETAIVLLLHIFYCLNARPSRPSHFSAPPQIAQFIFRIMFCLPSFTNGFDAVGADMQIINRHP
jgi:hypothetical protein